jgi:hypothetical protein
MKKDVHSRKWKELLAELESDTLAPEDVGPAIVRVAKADKPLSIHSLKKIIPQYFLHPDSWARHEAIWFVSWAKMTDLSPLIVERMRNDPDEDNRSFAALCLGHMYEGIKEIEILMILARTVRNPEETVDVRATAYGAILHLWYGKVGRRLEFDFGEANLDMIDWDWLNREIPAE